MKLTLLLLLAILVPFAYAEMEITTKSSYNIGEEIQALVVINEGSEFSGFQSAEIICDSYTKNYYKSPINVKGSDSLYIPPLKVFPQMKGECRIHSSLETIEGEILEESTSSEFAVTNLLLVDLNPVATSINPGEELSITGNVHNSRKEKIPAAVRATLGESSENIAIVNSDFSISVPVPENIKSGRNNVMLAFEDSNGNYKEEIVDFSVIARPTKISITMNMEEYIPYQIANAKVHILDQAGDVIRKEIETMLVKDKKTIDAKLTVNNDYSFKINNTLKPGKYSIKSVYLEISAEKEFSIAEFRQVKFELSGQTVVITNTGNVDHKNFTRIYLERDGISFYVEKMINIKPGFSAFIDLSTEVPGGMYAITMPSGEKYEQVQIDDNRGMLKKAYQWLSGSPAGNVAKGQEKPGITYAIIALFVVAILGMALVQYFKLNVFGGFKNSWLFKKFRK
ncbi:hypothetical protein J4401_04965 [Candidatus Woesearchaeota archaeon]|nr:hypothetical protein [Candidatus Woesearchaeota archaeon]